MFKAIIFLFILSWGSNLAQPFNYNASVIGGNCGGPHMQVLYRLTAEIAP